jgi:uncharacterized protein GlcG (DUF336 family)
MRFVVVLLLMSILTGCDSGAGGDGGPTVGASGGCTGGCAVASPTNLTIAEVNRIVSQAVLEAQSRGAANVSIAVVDRVGNVLAVYRLGSSALTISSGRGVSGGLEGVSIVPAEYAAISKAITGAYLSSEGNAFTTRTAGQIVQENFNPGQRGNPGGPLFGVQFSSLSCSDVAWNQGAGGTRGPHGSPLGLSADPGGLPLYKNGTVVGGIGVIADGLYSLDLNINFIDSNHLDEVIAVAGSYGFNAPVNRRADHIAVGGLTLRFTDSEFIISNPTVAPATPGGGSWVTVPGYFAGAVIAGTAFDTAASGFAPDTSGNFTGLNAYVLVDGTGTNRYPAKNGTDPVAQPLKQAEVTAILAQSILVANRTRSQIRQPLDSQAHVTIAVVDTNGAILGLIRTPDAPVFGTDVAVQKARSAMFFSRADAANQLINANPAGFNIGPVMNGPISQYVTSAQILLGGAAFANGIAYSTREIGLIARPFFPDGINGNNPGPFSRPFTTQWSPFNDGLELDLVGNEVVNNILRSAGNMAQSSACSSVSANGIQIFSGGFPIYRGSTLVGGIGISGDGINQDELIGFLGLHNAGLVLNNAIGNAPAFMRAETIFGLPGGLLRYVSCPVAPFLDDPTATGVCDGK